MPLRGRRLRFLQALWVILVLCDLFVLVVSLPAFYSALHSICITPIPSCQSDQLTPQGLAALLHAGFSLHAYALYVFSWDMLTSLAFLLVGAVIIWRRPNTWMGLFTSFLLINFGSLGLSISHVNALSAVPSDNTLVLVATIVGNPLSILAYLCLGFFFFTFPDGRFVPRWSWALISLWIVNFFFWTAPAEPASEYQPLASAALGGVAFYCVWRVARHPDVPLPAGGLRGAATTDQVADLWIRACAPSSDLLRTRRAAVSCAQ